MKTAKDGLGLLAGCHKYLTFLKTGSAVLCRVTTLNCEPPVADDDNTLAYFAEALKARGIDMEPELIKGFADKKARGETEAQILEEAGGTRAAEKQIRGRQMLKATALGAVATPAAAEILKNGSHSWREMAKRSPKYAALGAGLGAVAGWAIGKRDVGVNAGTIEKNWAEFESTVHEMDMAWTESLARRANQEPSAVSKTAGQPDNPSARR